MRIIKKQTQALITGYYKHAQSQTITATKKFNHELICIIYRLNEETFLLDTGLNRKHKEICKGQKNRTSI